MPGLHISEFSPLVEKCGAPHFLDEKGKPSFSLLQNYGSGGAPLVFYVFDVMILSGKDVMGRNARIATASA